MINEQSHKLKTQIIKKLISGTINIEKAALILNCSTKTIRRLKQKYVEKGPDGLEHGNKNKEPKTKIDQITKDKIIELYSNLYDYFNFLHFHEHLKKEHKIIVSYSTLESILKQSDFISPMCRRKTRKEHFFKLKNKVKNRDNLSETDKNYVVEKNILDLTYAHGRIPRSKYFGEVIQLDASLHLWFGNEKATLHLGVDNASNIITGGYFDYQETLSGYYNVLYQILQKYGIPASFLTDNRTIFYYKSIKQDKLLKTQFEIACKTMGISIETTSIPQAKGRVERMFNTLQSRLVSELRFNNITTIDEANSYLEAFIIDYNHTHALPLNNIKSVMESKPSNEDINLFLSVVKHRIIDQGGTVKYYNKNYFPIDETGTRVNIRPKTKVLIIQSFKGELYLHINESYYLMVELELHLAVSKEFDHDLPKPPKKVYTPPNNHPWKKEFMRRHLEKLVKANKE